MKNMNIEELKFIPTNVLLAELENRHLAMLFLGLPPSSHTNEQVGNYKIVKDLKGSSLLIIGMCEMMKTASLVNLFNKVEFGKDLQD